MSKIIIIIESESEGPYEYWEDFEVAIQNIFTDLDAYATGGSGNNYQYRIHPSNPVVSDLNKEESGDQGKILDTLDQEIERFKNPAFSSLWTSGYKAGLEAAREAIIRGLNDRSS